MEDLPPREVTLGAPSLMQGGAAGGGLTPQDARPSLPETLCQKGHNPKGLSENTPDLDELVKAIQQHSQSVTELSADDQSNVLSNALVTH